MSQIRSNIKLPSGNALEWDLSKFSQEALEYEYKIAYEALYGVDLTDKYGVKMPGLLVSTHLKERVGETQFEQAISVWTQRLRRAETALAERALLGGEDGSIRRQEV